MGNFNVEKENSDIYNSSGQVLSSPTHQLMPSLRNCLIWSKFIWKPVKTWRKEWSYIWRKTTMIGSKVYYILRSGTTNCVLKCAFLYLKASFIHSKNTVYTKSWFTTSYSTLLVHLTLFQEHQCLVYKRLQIYTAFALLPGKRSVWACNRDHNWKWL